VVLTDPESAVGFRLAGARPTAVNTAEEAQDVLEGLLEDEEIGLVAVNADYYNAMDEALKEKIEKRLYPLVVALPKPQIGLISEERTEYLARLIRRAIGFSIVLKR